jgi:predicted secreted protein
MHTLCNIKSVLRQSILIVCCVVVCFSCSNNGKSDNKVTLSQSTVTNIMKDVVNAEYMVRNSAKDSLEAEQMTNDYMQSICKHYNTTVEVYEHDLRIYLQKDKQMKNILEKIQR